MPSLSHGRLLACLVLGLAGCGPTGEPGERKPNQGFLVGDAGDPCGAGRWQDLVGRDSGVLNVAELPGRTRILYPDMSVTGDFVTDRMNVTVDRTNTITRVSCG